MNDAPLPPVRLRPLPAVIFAARWLQLPLYLGLILAMGIYVVQFWKEMVHLLHIVASKDISETEIMLGVLGLIDLVMIASISSIHLLKTFINAAHLEEKQMLRQVVIHVVFLVSALAIAASDRVLGIRYEPEHRA